MPPSRPRLSLPPGAVIRLAIRMPSTRCAPASGAFAKLTVDAHEALRTSVPAAITWLNGRPDQAPPGSLGTGEAARALAELAEAGLTDGQREEMMWFAVRVGARRLADAEHWLSQIGLQDAAAIAGAQAGWLAASSIRWSPETTPRSLRCCAI